VNVSAKKNGRKTMEQMQQQSLFDPRNGRHKKNDWVSSVDGARKVAYRAGTQKALLLQAFKDAYPADLTDEEAAVNAGVSLTSEYSKRCGELRQDEVIAVVWIDQDTPVTRLGGSGVQRIVSIYIPEES
jgi:hypothetical protein